MVPSNNTNANIKTFYFTSEQGSIIPSEQNKGNTPHVQEASTSGLSHFRETLKGKELSNAAIDILSSSLADGTSKQYKLHIDKWIQYCNKNNIQIFTASIVQGIEFLTKLHHDTNGGYSTINTARSALSLILRPISTDAFLQRSPEKFAEKHAQKETHQSKSVRHIEKFAGRIVEALSTFRRANLLFVNTSRWNFTIFIHMLSSKHWRLHTVFLQQAEFKYGILGGRSRH